MNLFEFLFAFFAVFGITGMHFLWIRFVYKLENEDRKTQTRTRTQELEETRIT